MKILTANRNTILKSHLIDSSSESLPQDFRSIPIKVGQKVIYNKIIKTEKNHYLLEIKTPIEGRFNWYAFVSHFDDPNPIVVRKDQVEGVFDRFNDKITDFQFKKLDECLKRFDIVTLPRVRHFLSQIAHESAGLRFLVEIHDGSNYEGRRDLGNTRPGDGKKFRGVDALQMTGRANYQLFANHIGDQRVMEGWKYVSERYLFLPSGFWWMNNKINELCDRGATVEQITRRVNGGTNGLAERKRYYERALRFI
jgi:predicted chitinase